MKWYTLVISSRCFRCVNQALLTLLDKQCSWVLPTSKVCDSQSFTWSDLASPSRNHVYSKQTNKGVIKCGQHNNHLKHKVVYWPRHVVVPAWQFFGLVSLEYKKTAYQNHLKSKLVLIGLDLIWFWCIKINATVHSKWTIQSNSFFGLTPPLSSVVP